MTGKSWIGATRALVAILILTSLWTAVAIPAAAQSGESSGTGEFSITELSKGGEHVSEQVPSLRVIGETSLYVDTEYDNPLKDSSESALSAGNVVEDGGVVRQNTLRFKHLDTKGRDLTLHIVYWSREARQTENGTKRVVAANQSHVTRQLQFDGPFATTKVDLREHYGEGKRVTMWIESYPDTARWMFVHKSLETSKAVETDTKGERTWWMIKSYGIWVVLFGFVSAGVSLWAVKRAGAGPMVGLGTWTFVLFIVGFLAIAIDYQGISTLFTRGPKLLAGATVALLTIPWVEKQDDRVDRYLFVKPVVDDAVTAAGTEGMDSLYLELATHRVTDLAKDGLAVVKPGPLKFLARVLGGAAPLIGAEDLEQTEVANRGPAKWDNIVWVDHNSDEIIDYQAEGFDLRRPPDLVLAIGAISIGLLTLNAWQIREPMLLWLGGLGLAIAVLGCLKVRQGHAKVDVADAHSRSAHITTMMLSKEIADAETLTDSRRETYRERAKTSKEIEDVVELRDETIIKEMLGVDVSATVSEPDDEHETLMDGGDQSDE